MGVVMDLIAFENQVVKMGKIIDSLTVLEKSPLIHETRVLLSLCNILIAQIRREECATSTGASST